MATLLDERLGALLDEDGRPVSEPVAAFVARVTKLALRVAARAGAAAVTRALASDGDVELAGALADLTAQARIAGTLSVPGDREAASPGPAAAASATADRQRAAGPTRAVAPLHESRLEGRLRLARLLDAAGGVWTAVEARRALGVSRTTLLTWRQQGKVLALPQPDGTFSYPVAQFRAPTSDIGRPAPLPGLRGVLAAAAGRVQPEVLLGMLLAPQPALRTLTPGLDAPTPLGLLDTQDPRAEAAVAALVRRFANPDEGEPAVQGADAVPERRQRPDATDRRRGERRADHDRRDAPPSAGLFGRLGMDAQTVSDETTAGEHAVDQVRVPAHT